MLYHSTFSENFLQHTHDVSMIMMNFHLPLQVVSSANRWKHKQAILWTIYTAASQNTCSRTCLFLASNKGASYRIFIVELGNCIFLHSLSLTAIERSSGNYRPPTILREGNVFSPVCHSVGERGRLPYRDPSIQLGPHCTTVQNLPSPTMFRLVHYESCTVGKRTVGILLECLLVYLAGSK